MIDVHIIRQLKSKKDFSDLLQLDYNNDCKLSISELSKSLNELYRISISDADTYLSTVINCSKYIPKEHHNKLLTMQARLSLWKADYNKALFFYNKALAQVLSKRDFYASAMIRKGMIEVYMYLSEYDEGLKTGKKALEYFKRKNLLNHAAQVMTNIGNIYHRMDKNRLALSYYDKAKDIFSQQGGVACAIVDFNRANIFANMNELTKAKKLYIEAGLFYKNSQMELAYQQTEYSIAYLFFLESKYTDALRLFEKVYDSFEELGDKTSAAVTQLDLAELNLQLNQYGSAIMLSEMIIPIFRKYKMPYEDGKAYYFSAIAKLELGDIFQTQKLLKEAKKVFVKEKNNLWLGMIENANNSLFISNKKYKKALEASISAKKYFRKSKDIRREHDADISHIQALFLSKNEKRAISKLKQLQNNSITLEQQRKIHALLGEYYFKKKMYQLAQEEFKNAVRIIEIMMEALYYEEIKFFFAADKFKIYSRIVECSLCLGKVETSYFQNLNALSLLNEKIIPKSSLKGKVPDKILSQINSLRHILSQAYKFPQKGERSAVAVHDIQKTEKQLWHFEQKARVSYNFDKQKNRKTVDKTSVFIPNKNELVLNYFISENKVGVFVQSKNDLSFIELQITLQELTELIRKIQFLFEQSLHKTGIANSIEIKRAYLLKLYQLLIAPIQIKDETERVYIIPDGILTQIPFIALCDDSGKYLKDRYAVSIITDPNSMNNNAAEKIDFSKLQNSIFSVSHESLPFVDIEGDKIHNRFKKSFCYKRQKANTLNLKRELKESTGFIHLAAHASRSSENPLFSRILLSDGVLFPFDLFGQGIQAELVTLSGCQTAAPGLNYGNTFSLAKTFYRAGSRFVLASLWPIDDKVTMMFMNEFYYQLSKIKNVEKSYTNAIQKISIQITDPAFWGAFILIGK